MIEPDMVKKFWEHRGAELAQKEFESIANLEPNPVLLAQKIAEESACILPLFRLNKSLRFLDLGAGVGQWALRVAPHVREVVAVEYASSIAQIGREAVRQSGFANITFVECAGEEYTSNTPFDLIFLSGLLLYLTDAQAERLLGNLQSLLAPEGRVCVRDATSILAERYSICNRWSGTLQANYSALYRTREEYIELFQRYGFALTYEQQIFPEGSPLNKFPETRLRFYVYTRGPHVA